MTDNNHPITPPPELVKQWATANGTVYKDLSVFCQNIANEAARWGTDQELEACCECIDGLAHGADAILADLRAARRPNPPSLKEQALALIDDCTDPHGDYLDDNALSTIRRALEALPDKC